MKISKEIIKERTTREHLTQAFRFDTLKVKHTTTSSFTPCKSQQFFNLLLFWRTLSLILTIFSCVLNSSHQFMDNVLDDDHQSQFILNFVNLCFIFLALYFLAAALLSFQDWRKKRNAYFVSVPASNSTTESLLYGSSMEEDDAIPEEVTIFHKIFWVMFEIGFTIAVFVDLVFWTALYGGTLDALVVVLHGLNGVLMTVELFLNSMVFVPAHIVFVWVVLLCYATEVWIWYLADNVWAYPFLDFSNHLAYLYYPALFLTATATFFIGLLCAKLRDRKNQKRKFPLTIQDHETFVF